MRPSPPSSSSSSSCPSRGTSPAERRRIGATRGYASGYETTNESRRYANATCRRPPRMAVFRRRRRRGRMHLRRGHRRGRDRAPNDGTRRAIWSRRVGDRGRGGRSPRRISRTWSRTRPAGRSRTNPLDQSMV